jgi:hypothetical protein
MPIVDAVKACLTKYAEFNGRATRTEYGFFLPSCLEVQLRRHLFEVLMLFRFLTLSC